jgi:hypothetical protein
VVDYHDHKRKFSIKPSITDGALHPIFSVKF